MPKLVFIDPHFSGRTYDLTVEHTTVGRAGHNTLVIHDESVSTNHCEILFNGPEVIVREKGSRNGTFVDGVKVTGQVPVKSGQVIRFGSVEARLELHEAPLDDSDTEMTAIYERARVEKEQRRKQKSGPLPAPGIVLDDGTPSGDTDHTSLFTRKDLEAAAVLAAPAPAAPAPPGKPFPLVPVLIITLAVVLGLLAWLLWFKNR